MSDAHRFVIFPAAPGDAGALGEVHVRSWRETYPGILSQAYLNGLSPASHARRFWRQLTHPNPGDVILAAEDRAGLVGYCAGLVSAHGNAEIHTLYLVKRAQGVGLGRRLMTDTARALHAKGAKRLIIWVLTDNIPARRFYERLGGRVAGEKTEAGPGGVKSQTAYGWDDLAALTETAE